LAIGERRLTNGFNVGGGKPVGVMCYY